MVLTKREVRMIWSFMVGATLSETIAAAFMFRPAGSWLNALWNFASRPPGTTSAWMLAVLVLGAYLIRSAARSPVIRAYAFSPARWHPFLGMRLFALPMAAVTGFFEEAFFRKWVMDWAQQEGAGIVMQVLWSAILFGIVHAIWVVFSGKFRAAGAIVVTTGALGGLLAIVYLLGGRSIGPCIAVHIGLNLFLEPWMVISSATQSWGKPALRDGQNGTTAAWIQGLRK